MEGESLTQQPAAERPSSLGVSALGRLGWLEQRHQRVVLMVEVAYGRNAGVTWRTRTKGS